MKEKRFELKKLQQALPDIEREAKDAQSLASIKQRKVNETKARIARLVEELTEEKREVEVSDHAVIRYLERKYNLNIEDMRKEILTQTVRDAIKMGATSVMVDGLSYKVSNKVITTVV